MDVVLSLLGKVKVHNDSFIRAMHKPQFCRPPVAPLPGKCLGYSGITVALEHFLFVGSKYFNQMSNYLECPA